MAVIGVVVGIDGNTDELNFSVTPIEGSSEDVPIEPSVVVDGTRDVVPSLDETVVRSSEDESSVFELVPSIELDDGVTVTVESRTEDLLFEVLPVTVRDGDKVKYDVENELADFVTVVGVAEGMDDKTEEVELPSIPVSATVLTDDGLNVDLSTEDTDDVWPDEIELLMGLEEAVKEDVWTKDELFSVPYVDIIDDDDNVIGVVVGIEGNNEVLSGFRLWVTLSTCTEVDIVDVPL